MVERREGLERLLLGVVRRSSIVLDWDIDSRSNRHPVRQPAECDRGQGDWYLIFAFEA